MSVPCRPPLLAARARVPVYPLAGLFSALALGAALGWLMIWSYPYPSSKSALVTSILSLAAINGVSSLWSP